MRTALAIIAVLLLCLAPSALPLPIVSGGVMFDSGPEGYYGDWTITYNATGLPPGLKLDSVLINLNSNLFFDTTSAQPGTPRYWSWLQWQWKQDDGSYQDITFTNANAAAVDSWIEDRKQEYFNICCRTHYAAASRWMMSSMA